MKRVKFIHNNQELFFIDSDGEKILIHAWPNFQSAPAHAEQLNDAIEKLNFYAIASHLNLLSVKNTKELIGKIIDDVYRFRVDFNREKNYDIYLTPREYTFLLTKVKSDSTFRVVLSALASSNPNSPTTLILSPNDKSELIKAAIELKFTNPVREIK